MRLPQPDPLVAQCHVDGELAGSAAPDDHLPRDARGDGGGREHVFRDAVPGQARNGQRGDDVDDRGNGDPAEMPAHAPRKEECGPDHDQPEVRLGQVGGSERELERDDPPDEHGEGEGQGEHVWVAAEATPGQPGDGAECSDHDGDQDRPRHRVQADDGRRYDHHSKAQWSRDADGLTDVLPLEHACTRVMRTHRNSAALALGPPHLRGIVRERTTSSA